MKVLYYTAIAFVTMAVFHADSFAAYQGFSTFDFNDASRNRTVSCIVYYPATEYGIDQPLADASSDYHMSVMVFGHGFQTGYDAYNIYAGSFIPMNTPASFVMIVPTTEMGANPNTQQYALDMVACLDYMQREGARAASRFYNHIDDSNIILGHSMGGGAAVFASEYVLKHTTLNLVKLILLAPAQTTPTFFTAARSVTCQTMILAAEKDCVSPMASVIRPLYDSLGTSCKALVTVTGGTHCQFAYYNTACSALETGCVSTRTLESQQDAATRYITYFLFPNRFGDFTKVYSNCTVIATQNNLNNIITFSKTSGCVGDTITLSTKTPLTSYLWLPDSVTTRTYTFVLSKTTHVTLKENLCMPEYETSITILAGAARSNVIQGNKIFCPGEQTFLSIDTVSFKQCVWSTGETTKFIRVTTPGVYSVTSFDPLACTYTTDSATVSVRTPTKVTLQPGGGGDFYFCEGSGVTLRFDGPLTFTDYNWSWSNGSHGYIISYNTDTTVKLWVYGKHRTSSCTFYSDTLTCSFHPVSNPKPVIVRNLNTLSASAADIYSWRLNKVVIPQAPDRTYSPETPGKYSVMVTYFKADTCSNTSDEFDFDFQSEVDETYKPDVSISLREGRLQVRDLISDQNIVICDLLGRPVFSQFVQENHCMIDVSLLTAGAYYMRIGNDCRTHCIIVN